MGWQVSLGVLLAPVYVVEKHSGGWWILVLFALPFFVVNVVLLVLPPMSFASLHERTVRRFNWLAGFCVAHVAAAYLFHASFRATHRLQVGYYALLLASVALFYGCQLRKRGLQSEAEHSPYDSSGDCDLNVTRCAIATECCSRKWP